MKGMTEISPEFPEKILYLNGKTTRLLLNP
jgi:hypothetical protein